MARLGKHPLDVVGGRLTATSSSDQRNLRHFIAGLVELHDDSPKSSMLVLPRPSGARPRTGWHYTAGRRAQSSQRSSSPASHYRCRSGRPPTGAVALCPFRTHQHGSTTGCSSVHWGNVAPLCRCVIDHRRLRPTAIEGDFSKKRPRRVKAN